MQLREILPAWVGDGTATEEDEEEVMVTVVAVGLVLTGPPVAGEIGVVMPVIVAKGSLIGVEEYSVKVYVSVMMSPVEMGPSAITQYL